MKHIQNLRRFLQDVKYSFKGETVKGAFERIANTMCEHYTVDVELARKKFFDIMWKGFLAPSTPVFANSGTGRGLVVSCAGSYTADSIDGFYKSYHETAVLSQEGFGTSSYLGDIRPRGAKIGRGGEADGVVPVNVGIKSYTSVVVQVKGIFGNQIQLINYHLKQLKTLVFLSKPVIYVMK